jgi:hypothetical protein
MAEATEAPSEPQKEWTFMVYLAGDNSLTEEMVWSLQEIQKASADPAIQEDVNVVAHFDPRGAKGRRYDFTAPQTGSSALSRPGGGSLEDYIGVIYTERFLDAALARQLAHEITAEAGKEELREKLAELFIASGPKLDEAVAAGADAAGDFLADKLPKPDVPDSGLAGPDNLREVLKKRLRQSEMALSLLGDASKALSAFVEDQMTRLPVARKFFVVFSGHGSGATGDFLTDLDPATSLSIPELARILKGARERFERKHGASGDQSPDPMRISILGMDSCLMSTAEVCFEIRDHADYLVGSEGWVQNTGWPYRRVLEALKSRDAIEESAESVAGRVARGYSDFYRDYEISGVSTDIAVCDLSKLRDEGDGSLIRALQALCETCVPTLEGLYAYEFARRRGEGGAHAEGSVIDSIVETLNAGSAEELALKTTGADHLLAYVKQPDARDRSLSVSQSKALWRLLDSIEKTCHVCSPGQAGPASAQVDAGPGSAKGSETPAACVTLEERLARQHAAIESALTRPASFDIAYTAAAAIREFDPGIRKVLTQVELAEAAGIRSARKARLLLEKLHQIRWVLDVRRLVEETEKELKLDKTALDKRIERAILLRTALVTSRQEAQSFKGGVYMDLLDFCERLVANSTDADITTRADNLIAAIRAAARPCYTTGGDFQHANGLSVFFPVDALDYSAEYENLEFAAITGWGRFVRSYLRATRRTRRFEKENWSNCDRPVLRFNDLAADPLEEDTIEARITGAIDDEDRVLPKDVVSGGDSNKFGTAKKIKFGTAKKIKFGTAKKIKFGTAKKIKFGTARKIKGEGILASIGNPPDGFYRPRE